MCKSSFPSDKDFLTSAFIQRHNYIDTESTCTQPVEVTFIKQFHIKNMASRRGKIGNIGKSFKHSSQACTECLKKEEQVKAVQYCMSCKDYLCEKCLKSNTSMESVSGHVIVKIPNQGNLQELTSAMTCQDHPEMIIDMICETHDEVGCYTCMTIKHKDR